MKNKYIGHFRHLDHREVRLTTTMTPQGQIGAGHRRDANYVSVALAPGNISRTNQCLSTAV